MPEEIEPLFDFRGKHEDLEDHISSQLRQAVKNIFGAYERVGGEYTELERRLLRGILQESFDWEVASAMMDGVFEKDRRKQAARQAEIDAMLPTLEPDLITILRQGKKISAIKHLRMVVGAENIGLAEAKEQIDALNERLKRGEL